MLVFAIGLGIPFFLMLVYPGLTYNHLLIFLFCHSRSVFFFRQAFQSLSHYSDASEMQVIDDQILLTIDMHVGFGIKCPHASDETCSGVLWHVLYSVLSCIL